MATSKTLRVCLSKDLPDILDRDPNFLYFLYDKLMLFMGQNIYNDPFCIVSALPDDPVTGMLYIDFGDGIVKSYIDNAIINIATIESDDQKEILKKSGTTFFTNSDKRYLDIQRRILTLPYLNGNYVLTVDVANDLVLDKNTVLRFNTETNQFEIDGDSFDIDKPFRKTYTGKETNSTFTNVDDYAIHTDVKISPAFDNIIKVLDDGIYASANDRVPVKEFNSWKSSFENYKINMESYLNELAEKIDSTSGEVSSDSINAKIKEALDKVYPEIDHAMETLIDMSDRFSGIESRCKSYTDDKFKSSDSELRELIEDATNNPWETIT